MELILEIETRYKRYKDRYKCVCDKLKLTGTSDESFEDAHEKLMELIEQRIWKLEFTTKIKIKIKYL